MSGADGSNETSTVNGYVFFHNGNPLASSAMGGPARQLVPPNDRFKLAADDNFSGRGTDYSKFVAWTVGSVTGNQIIYACLSTPIGNAAWMIRQVNDTVEITIGNGGGGQNAYVIATGLVIGQNIGIGISVPDLLLTNVEAYVNGVHEGSHPCTHVTATGLFGFCGGWDSGQAATAKIVAPTGWRRLLDASEHAAMWNGGNPRRLT